MSEIIIPSGNFTVPERIDYAGPLFKSFGDGSHYVMTGDYREVPCGVFTIRATIVPDYDSRPEDFGGCYTPEAVAAWSRDDWSYVGVVLSVHWGEEITLDRHAASLWGLECNLDGDNAYLSEAANELLPQAAARAIELRGMMQNAFAKAGEG